ncbi:MAG TPA: NUDIX domain-containing protein, partial [Streptosporangiaceae bacterium]
MGEAAPLPKHATASVFVFCPLPGGWHIGLISHPRLRRMMIPGGHVEAAESVAEAAVREVAEEAGLVVDLLPPPAAPLPGGYRPHRVPPPWWTVEYQVPPDSHLAVAHIHVDHLYVAVTSLPRPVSEPAHPFGWYPAADLPGLEMFDDARILAGTLLAGLADSAADGGAGAGGAGASGQVLVTAILARLAVED